MSAVRLTRRRIVEVAGPDASGFLQGLISQSVDALSAGEARLGALLTPQGKIAADFIALRTPDGFLFDVHDAIAEAFVKKLSVYKLRASVRIAPRPDLGVAAGEPTAPAGLLVFSDPRLAALGPRTIGPVEALAADETTERQYQRRRRGLGAPELGEDFQPDSCFLTDVNFDALGGVDYRKGCFVGQEVTSRMKRKGEIRRRTMIIRGDGAPPPGATIEADGVAIGEVFAIEDGVGLGLIRLDRLADAQGAGAESRAAGATLRLELPTYLEEA